VFDPKLIRTFLAVAKHKNFSRAAKAVTQPNPAYRNTLRSSRSSSKSSYSCALDIRSNSLHQERSSSIMLSG
jgi:hypothetical protein